MELQFIFTKHGRNKKEQYWDILFGYYTTPAGIEERRKSLHIISILVEVIVSGEIKQDVCVFTYTYTCTLLFNFTFI